MDADFTIQGKRKKCRYCPAQKHVTEFHQCLPMLQAHIATRNIKRQVRHQSDRAMLCLVVSVLFALGAIWYLLNVAHF